MSDSSPGPVRIRDTYCDIAVTEYSGEVRTYRDVTWSVDKSSEHLCIYNSAGRRFVEYSEQGWHKVVILES